MPPRAGGPLLKPSRHSAPARPGELPAPCEQKAGGAGREINTTSLQEKLGSLKLWLAKTNTGTAFLEADLDPPDPLEKQSVLADAPINMRTKHCLKEWAGLGTASNECLLIIKSGLYVNIEKTDKHSYEEPNNRSFTSDTKFGVQAIKELLLTGAVVICKREDLRAVNPLSIAVNAKGKKRLCLGEYRHDGNIAR